MIDVTITRIVLGGRWPVIGEPTVYPKVKRMVLSDGCLMLYRAKYDGLPHNTDEVHVVSMPLSTVWEWTVDGA